MKVITNNKCQIIKFIAKLSLLIYTFSPGYLEAQTDYEFWFAAPEISYEYIAPSPFIYQGLDRPIRIYLTTADGPANFTIDQPANPAFPPISGVVKTDSTKQVDITAFIDAVENKPANTILNYGLRILSNKPITAYYEVQSLYNQDTFVLKGRNALGFEFIIPAQSHFNNYVNCNPAARNSFIIVASEDSTNITIIPSNNIEGHARNDTVILQLNQGQTWCARAMSGDSTNHLGGSCVIADKPIAVTIADDEVMYPSALNYSKDLAGDQLIPRNLCGTAYIADLTSLPAPVGAIAMIYAFEDSTIVAINGGPGIRIDRGQVYEFKIFGPGFVSYITSSKQVLAYHFRGTMIYNWNFSGCIIPPLSNCSGSKRISICRTPPILPDAGYYLYFVTQSGNQGNFTVIGNPSFVIPAIGWDTVPGTNSQWLYYGLAWSDAGAQSYIISNSTGRFQMSSSTQIDEYFDKGNYYTDVSSLNLGPDRKICPDESLKIDAGYGWTSYLWNSGANTQSIEVFNPGTYWVQVSDGICVLQDTIVISYYWSQPLNIGPDLQICSGDSVQLNAGTGRDWYAWNTGDSTQTIWVKTPGTFWVTVPDVHCNLHDTVLVSTIPEPFVINNPLSKAICSGESTAIPLTSNVPGAMFHWTASLSLGTVTGFTADSGLMINQTLMNTGPTSGVVAYHITPKIGECVGATVDFTVTVTPGNPVGVSITCTANNVCAGTLVTFTAATVNPGANPAYQWKVNAISVINANNSVYTYSPVNGDIVECMVTSSNTICTSNNPATSNSITMVVNPVLPVSVVIVPSINPVCSGGAVLFTTAVVNGGSSPGYQWKINAANAINANNAMYTYIPTNGDAVTCEVTSSEPCPTGNPATSAPVTMVVNTSLPAGVTISASPNPFCPGTMVNFTAVPVNGGSSPTYQWLVNGANQFTGSPVYQFIPQAGDSIRCIVTSNLSCVTGNPAGSNKIIMTEKIKPTVTFAPCFDTITTVNAKPFKLKGGLPIGGTYSGPGVNSTTGIFTPFLAGPGTHQITYSYTNVHGCQSNAMCNVQCANSSAFTCGNNLTDVRDGKVYPTVLIGMQCWFQKNLEYGLTIPDNIPQTDNCIAERYNRQSSIVQSYMYQWDELMAYQTAEGSQGLCPPGWHVPTEAEWNVLLSFYNGAGQAAGPMKDTLPANGFQSWQHGFYYLNNTWAFTTGLYAGSMYWSSTLSGLSNPSGLRAIARGLNEYNPSVSKYPAFRSNGFGVRCCHD